MIALAESTTITVSVVGAIVALAAFALLRVVLRREPSPARWRRIRLGVFVEREPIDSDKPDEPS